MMTRWSVDHLCTYDDEMVYCYDAEVEDYNYDAVDYFEL